VLRRGNDHNLKEHLRQLEEMLLQPEIRRSKSEVEKVVAEDFFEFGSSGKVLYQGSGIKEEGLAIVNMTMSDFVIHPLTTDVVLATYRICNRETNEHSLRSSIWKKTHESWRMCFHQGTKTAD